MSMNKSDSDHLLVATGISKSFGRVQALAPLSLTISQGERVALAGPSGSGKTTLLYLLAGIIQPDAGEVFLAGQDLARQRPGKEKAGLVGLIHQQYDLVPHLPVLHNVLAGRLGQWSLFRSMISLVWPQDRQVAEEALAQMGIADKIHERTSHLSGGEQQMLAIARILRTGAPLLLLDEPTEGLAPVIVQQIGRTILALKQEGFTIVLVEQNFRFAASVADRHYVVEQGKVADMIPNSELDANIDKLHAYLGV